MLKLEDSPRNDGCDGDKMDLTDPMEVGTDLTGLNGFNRSKRI